MPHVCSLSTRNAATRTSSVPAISRYDAGTEVIVSPCDIHTCVLAGSPAISGSAASPTVSIARPYSRLGAGCTSPPKAEARYCAP